MKTYEKEDYDRLLKAELEWIPKDSECYQEFWINGRFTHIVISKKSDGHYQIIRSWMMKEPAVSLDIEDTDIHGVVSYILRKLLDIEIAHEE